MKRILSLIISMTLIFSMGFLFPKSSNFSLTTKMVAEAASADDVVNIACQYIGNTSYSGLCLKFVQNVFDAAGIKANRLAAAKNARELWQTHTDRNIPAGACVFFDDEFGIEYHDFSKGPFGYYGHIEISAGDGVIIGSGTGKITKRKMNDYYWQHYTGWGWYNGIALSPDPNDGHIMDESEAAGQTIPDGDYWIQSALNDRYYLDIEGDGLAKNDSNVQMRLWGNQKPSINDVWTVTYKGNGFYNIKQKTSNEWLHVWADSTSLHANIFMYSENDWNAQQWSIAPSDSGYTLQAKCSSFYLDIEDAKVESGTNVQQYLGNGSLCQQWKFIPYPEKIKGDCNNDGKFSVLDVVVLQKWILAMPDVKLTDWQAADLCEDGVINAFDLVMMKRMLINK